jgi:hypothetical protein
VVVRRDVLSVPDRLAPGQYTLEAVLSDEQMQPLRPDGQPGLGVPLTTVRVTAR